MQKNGFQMPVKVQPFQHQKKAFDFACDVFGLGDFVKTSSGVALLMEKRGK